MEEENNSKFKCEECNYKTNYKSSYDKHLRSVLHQTGERKIRSDKKNKNCNICEYSCSTEKNLKSHKLIYHLTKDDRKEKFKYYCEKCDYGNDCNILYKKHLESKKHNMMNIYFNIL